MPSKQPVRASDDPAPGANKGLVVDLLCQALENDLGGARVYAAALPAAQDHGLRALWTASKAASGDRARFLGRAFVTLGIDPAQETLGREAVRQTVDSLLTVLEDHCPGAPLEPAQRVAVDCVVVVEAKADASWRLIRVLSKALKGDRGAILKTACQEVDASGGIASGTAAWAHELWLRGIGLPATLPPATKDPLVLDGRAGRAPRHRLG